MGMFVVDTCLANMLAVEYKLERAEEEQSMAVANAARFGKGKHRKGSWKDSREHVHDERVCYHCGEPGHLKVNCEKRKAELKMFELHQQQQRARKQRPSLSFATAY